MRTQTNSARRLFSIRCPRSTLIASLTLAALGFLLAACGGIIAQRTEYVGAPHYPHTDPGSIAVLHSEPARPHDRLGEILLDCSSGSPPSVAEVEARLRTEAAKMGADAAVVVYDGLGPTGFVLSGSNWNRSIEKNTGRKVIGVAIKYKQA